MKNITLLSIVGLGLNISVASAAVLCAGTRDDGTFNSNIALREACKRKETQLDPSMLGLTGPAGPRGEQGPPGLPGGSVASLAGVPCSTVNGAPPDGETVTSVDPQTGALSLRCDSANPTLDVLLVPANEQVCNTFAGITLCFLPRAIVEEVDSSGVPVPQGFRCETSPNLVVFPFRCTTKRFAVGTTIRLRATATSSLTPVWNGCNDVSNGVCAIVVTEDRSVTVQPQ